MLWKFCEEMFHVPLQGFVPRF